MNGFTEGCNQTDSLLACKRWWKVCFLHGDQEKYYRQIYSQAASQRIAISLQNDEHLPQQGNEISKQKDKLTLPTLFPMKHSARRRHKECSSNREKHEINNSEINNIDKGINLSSNYVCPELKEYVNLYKENGYEECVMDVGKQEHIDNELWKIIKTNELVPCCNFINSAMKTEIDNEAKPKHINNLSRCENSEYYESLIDVINSG